MGKRPYSSINMPERGYRPLHGYKHVFGQCSGCKRTWANVGIKFNKNKYLFDFDYQCDIIGEVAFNNKTETVTCLKCGSEVKFFSFNPTLTLYDNRG